jgi:hypothetical protein
MQKIPSLLKVRQTKDEEPVKTKSRLVGFAEKMKLCALVRPKQDQSVLNTSVHHESRGQESYI